MTTGERLRHAIRSRFGDGLKQGAVAKRLGISPGNLSEWLNDEYEPTLKSLRRLARKLKCDLESLIGDEGAS